PHSFATLLFYCHLAHFALTTFPTRRSSDLLSQDVFNSANQGIIVTDQTGKIVSVNNAFVKITGYDEKDAIGERANILSSGNQDKELFAEMWKQITSK